MAAARGTRVAQPSVATRTDTAPTAPTAPNAVGHRGRPILETTE